MTIIGLAEGFKMMNWPDQTITLFDGLFTENHKRYGLRLLKKISFKTSICTINIWD